jgi:nucleoid-associated protein EbfC
VFSGGGQPDMAQLLAQAQQMQQRLADAQDELARTQVQGTAGGGLVKASVSGAGEVLALEISPEACDPADTESLADLVIAAIRDATQAAASLQERLMAPLTQGLGIDGIGMGGPGLDGPDPGDFGRLGR